MVSALPKKKPPEPVKGNRAALVKKAGYTMSCRHKPTGFVTNQDPHEELDASRAHMSQVTCSRPECVAKTQSTVAAFTNETASYYPFGAYRKSVSA